jgi:hypothetical protein
MRNIRKPITLSRAMETPRTVMAGRNMLSRNIANRFIDTRPAMAMAPTEEKQPAKGMRWLVQRS